jgi:hypothetical protein
MTFVGRDAGSFARRAGIRSDAMPKHRERRRDEPDAQKTRVPKGLRPDGASRSSLRLARTFGYERRLAPAIYPVRTATWLRDGHVHRS